MLLPSYMSFSDLIYSKHIWIVWNNTYFLFICLKKCKCKCNMIEWIIIANSSFLSYHRSRYPFSWPSNFSIPLNITDGVYIPATLIFSLSKRVIFLMSLMKTEILNVLVSFGLSFHISLIHQKMKIVINPTMRRQME